MKISKICALVLLLVVGSAVAFADGINDPKIIIQGVAGGGGKTPGGSCPKCMGVGINFTVTIPKDGSGFEEFTNTSGKNWTSLTLIESGVPAADISCEQSFFLSCTTKTLKNGSVEILLTGVRGNNARTGIGAGANFEIGFACVSGSCWPGGLKLHAHAGAAPEPETLALMVTGLGMIVSRRKLWKSRFNS